MGFPIKDSWVKVDNVDMSLKLCSKDNDGN